MMNTQIFTDVYYARLPAVLGRRSVYPPERQDYILQASNEKVARQRYYVWILLERAVELSLGKSLADIQLSRTKQGRWISPAVFFSLSHGENAVAVAVSNAPIGVDIQAEIQKKADFFLTKEERTAYETATDKVWFLTELWTKKESIFKKTNGTRFDPKRLCANEHFTQTQAIAIDGKRYALSVTSPIRTLQEIQL